MIGPLAAGKKAAEFGYKVYGIPGAAVAGAGGAVGVVAAKKSAEALVDVEGDATTNAIAEGEGTRIEVEMEESADDGDSAPTDR